MPSRPSVPPRSSFAPRLSLPEAVGAASIVLAWWFAFRDMRMAGRFMLALELAAIAGILVLCVIILRDVHPDLAAPLNDLALRYASPRMAVALDLAAASSGRSVGAGRMGHQYLHRCTACSWLILRSAALISSPGAKGAGTAWINWSAVPSRSVAAVKDGAFGSSTSTGSMTAILIPGLRNRSRSTVPRNFAA